MVSSKSEKIGNKKTSKKKKASNRPKLGRIKKLKQELKQERERSSEQMKRLMYLQGDFENFKKRKEKEFNEISQRVNERLVVSLLSVLDELELAILSAKETANKESLLEGVKMVLKKLYTTLEREGLSEIETIGMPFDPKKHEVFLQVSSPGHAEGTVIEEVRKGFMFRNKVIRPSMVKIVKEVGMHS
jgi:molecular chaperone GrpE